MIKDRMFILIIALVLIVGLFGSLNAKKDIGVIQDPLGDELEGPLLGTVWFQTAPYNDDCPEQGGVHMVAGPVAVAYAQIMNYHEWPVVGNGSIVELDWDGDNCQGGQDPTTFYVPLNTYYDYDNMTAYCGVCTPEQEAAVAKLIWDVGAAFNTNYNSICPGGYSGANPYHGTTILPQKFRYQPTMYYLNIGGFGVDARYNFVKGQIDDNQPLIYIVPGTAVVCDGYKTEMGEKYIHINPGGWIRVSSIPGNADIILEIKPNRTPVPACVVPRTWWVSESGDDLNGGYQYSPFATINHAIQAAQECDTIMVMPGTYNEAVNFLDKNVAVISTDGPLVTTIIGDNPSYDVVMFVGGQDYTAIIEGFTLSGGRNGVWCQDSGPTIKGNIILDQDQGGSAGILLMGAGMYGPSPAVILNNTIANTENVGITNISIQSPIIKNNIITGNSVGIMQYQDAATPTLGYNDVWNNGTDYFYLTPGTGSISENPMFASDFSLYEGSPCINTGDPHPGYYNPDGSRNTMGAVWQVTEPQFDNTYYVDGANGNDDWLGTEDYPFATIQKAIDESVNGFTINVAEGVYTESLVINGKTISIIATDGPKYTTITNDNNSTLVTFTDVPSSDAVFDGFTLTGGWIGIWCQNSGPTISHNILEYQTVNNWAALVLSGEGYGLHGISPAVVVNNVIIRCSNGGLSSFSTVSPTVLNNVIMHNQYGIHQENSAAPIINDYNDVWDNPAWPYNNPPWWYPRNYYGPVVAGPNNICAEPYFTPEYHLFVGSPCLDAGDPDPVYNDPDGTRNDMGALWGEREPGVIYVPGDYSSIQLAIDAASSGQTIYVDSGTYNESLRFRGKTLRVIGVNGPEKTFLEAGAWGFAAQIADHEGLGTELSGFTITNEYGSIDDVQVGVGASAVIQNCVFKDKPTSALNAYNINCGGSNSGTVLITGNVFYNSLADDCIHIHPGSYHITITNNTIDNCYQGATATSSANVFKNNIVTNCTSYGVYGDFATLDYNDVWNNGNDYGGAANPGVNSISDDPLYVDAANYDYNLQTGSPCIGTGDPTGTDMGAYPYEGGLLKPTVDRTSLPQMFALAQNYPNPFNPITDISFSLPEASDVRLEIYNIMGQKVKTLVEGQMDAGYKTVVWDGKSNSGSSVASGIYFYRLTAGDYVNTKKMTLLK
jgi:Peptidase C10 family/FlgD Ig-like domain/Right handed beta helix region/Protein of unknown function (DUF1565)